MMCVSWYRVKVIPIDGAKLHIGSQNDVPLMKRLLIVLHASWNGAALNSGLSTMVVWRIDIFITIGTFIQVLFLLILWVEFT